MTETKPAVSAHIVAWNGMTHLPSCIRSLTEQTYQPLRILVVDNGSVDGTVQWLASEYPQVHLLRNTRNLGFCHGHNQAFRIAEAPYVLCLNQDMVVTPTWVEQAVAFMESHPQVGAVGGKLLRYSYSDEELKRVIPSGIIDSAGLQIFRSRHVIDRGSGEEDTGQYDGSEEVFGLTGACVLFRRTALESIRYKDEFFDEDFFAYKDDVDVARRLARLQWQSWYHGALVAYHHRSIQGQSGTKNVQIARNFRRRSHFNATYSYRNHLLVAMKHETAATVMPDLPWIVWYEFRKAVFLLFTRPTVLSGFGKALALRRSMASKAALLNHVARQPATVVRRWWTATTS